MLAQENADVNVQDLNGDIPLHLAAEECNIESLKLLLAQPSINVNIRNSKGVTALSIAQSLFNPKKEEILNLLKQNRATQ